MFGTPNQGAFSAFDAMLNGEALLGRELPFVDDFRAEDVFTLPASYQLLPHPGTARFLDDQLKLHGSIRRLDVEGGWCAVLQVPAKQPD